MALEFRGQNPPWAQWNLVVLYDVSDSMKVLAMFVVVFDVDLMDA